MRGWPTCGLLGRGSGLVVARCFWALARRSGCAVLTDITEPAGIDFKHQSSATSNKYLIETMGGGVALLDYDNDGRLDVFFTNGARIDDPMPQGTRPDKSAPGIWNRLYRQNADGTFSDIDGEGRPHAGCRRTTTAWAPPSGTTITMALPISM